MGRGEAVGDSGVRIFICFQTCYMSSLSFKFMLNFLLTSS